MSDNTANAIPAAILIRIPDSVPPSTPDEQAHKIACQQANTILEGGGAIDFMTISAKEGPFLVGMKGRNISLIRKCSGMILSIKGDTVSMSRQRPSSRPEMAARMVLSACCGGILRWFVTQAATTTGYPFDKIYTFEMLAQKHNCTLKLLRARCGHMCLMLIPEMPAAPIATLADQLRFRAHIADARKELLEALG